MTRQTEVIAVLMPEFIASHGGDPREDTVTLTLRTADGRLLTQAIDTTTTFGQHALRTGRFSKGKPIIDPDTLELIGYEMERIAAPTAAFA